MSVTSTRRPTARTLLRYRTVDLVTVGTLGVAFGVVFWGWNQLYAVVSTLGVFAYPPSGGLLGGPWLIAGVVGGLVVRRPGAALACELLAAAVSGLLGNQWGMSVLGSGLVQGLGAELVLAVLLYRRFGPAAAAAAGLVAGAFAAGYETNVYYVDWDLPYRLAYAGFFGLSGAVVAGVGGWLLVRALATTGALDAFGPGRDRLRRRTS